ncbi:response regulator [Achromobacter sp. GG226]|uniref:response regulator n=1 Tax=Verticiella alkaliphila TaxID=2779529 RepID=UPI001C0AAB9A|nr:response regulator [Verticiella sp. GG226]MBU4610524.1 response regulator [Verticiella sp. GG226]
MNVPRTSRTVLIVDDSVTVRRMVAAVLESAGWPVLVANDGAEALSLLEREVVGLVITDLNMPEMDGITLIERLRRLPALAEVPILVLTTEMDEDTKARARDAGASGWLGKPVDGRAITDVTAALLG